MVEPMEVLQLEACAEELAAASNATPIIDAATRAVRQARAVQLDEVRFIVDSGAYFTRGHRSPAAWLCETTRESDGHCTQTISLAKRIVEMPLVHTTFAAGDLAETGLRLLTETWTPTVADQFTRDETMLLGWATTLPAKDLSMLLDTWRMHVDPNREASTAQERFDQRSVHLSKLLNGVGRLDGTLDPDGYRLLNEAIRALSQPAEDETRTAAQRRHDALVQMAKIALESFTPVPGKKRRKPTVIGTATVTDMTDKTGGGAVDTGGERDIVPIATIRRMACDCEMHRYLANAAGHIINSGRKRRLVSDVQFDLLLIRDHGCRWRGCNVPAAGCDAHHADHWLDGGETEPDNLVLLCWYHHHLLHEQHWSIQPLGAGHFTLNTPDGDERPMRPPLIGAVPPLPPPAPLPRSTGGQL
jgi:hypothetical protein